MTHPPEPLRSLERLVDVREREVDRLTADMADKRALRDRFLRSIERMEHLAHSSGASGGTLLAQALNRGAYKQAMLHLAHTHRQDLGRHEADLAQAQQQLTQAVRRKEVLGQVLEQRQQVQALAAQALQQKRDDELASQVWWRGQA
ncbi:flagellar export protein FliJ [Paracidovorax anthurii]|uniref:Flagellar export protein FliJ n=1 Tax=Paracidovorax anthurii TaxID=78229 RepID=A0A328YSM5_9BURK|nr:flagellar export protein FliJ [Paracidovorax anthurii]RAR76849.1 flagellar export protein FliJ [Paracidovorax anthurii]WCM93794.1 flagellar export protein FliJ [Acidovorax sp. NCPPB 2350]